MSAENTMPKKNFYSVRECKFRFFVPEKTATSKQVASTNDPAKIYHYEEYNQITGHLRKFMQWTEEGKTDTSKTWEMFAIDLRDKDNGLDCAQMYFDSNATTSFLKRLPNIDLSKEVQIKVRQDDKGYPRLDVYQVNEFGKQALIPYYWNEANPLPKWNQLSPAKGKKKAVWDKSEQEELLTELYKLKNDEIADTIKAIQRDGIDPEKIAEMKTDTKFGKMLIYKPEERANDQAGSDNDVIHGAIATAAKEDDLPF